jgi:capsular polysaccharide biosynthesis protein
VNKLSDPAEQVAAAGQRQGTWVTYLSAIRAHRLLVFLITLAAVAASAVFLLQRSPDYEATAKLLVEPLPPEDQTFLGLPLIRDTGDPVRTMQTAASLVESQPAAARLAAQPGQDLTSEQILDRIKVSPEGESNILAVTATADSADGAARLANQFSRAVLSVHSDDIDNAAGALITQLQAALKATPTTDQATRADISSRLNQVNSVVSRGDPTLQLSQPAVPPTAATGPSAALIIVLALIAGFALGSGTAVLLQLATGPRDEEGPPTRDREGARDRERERLRDRDRERLRDRDRERLRDRDRERLRDRAREARPDQEE